MSPEGPKEKKLKSFADLAELDRKKEEEKKLAKKLAKPLAKKLAEELADPASLLASKKASKKDLFQALKPKGIRRQQLNIRVEPLLAKRLHLFCAQTRFKLQDIVTVAIESFLSEQEEKLAKPLAKKIADPLAKELAKSPENPEVLTLNVNVSRNRDDIENNVNVIEELRYANALVQLIVRDILEVLGDEHSRGFYTKVARVLDPELIYRALAEVKEEEQIGTIQTTKGAVFTDKIKRWAAEQEIQL